MPNAGKECLGQPAHLGSLRQSIISPAIVIDNRLIISENLVIIKPICLNMTLIICYTLLYIFG